MTAPFVVWTLARGVPSVIGHADTLTSARALWHIARVAVITCGGKVVDSLAGGSETAAIEKAAAKAWETGEQPPRAVSSKAPAPRPSPRPFVGGTLTETPVEPIGVQLARKPAQVAAARDAPLVEQLRGEVEGLTTDLSVARHDLARAIERSGEMAADLGAQIDDALALLDLAMTAGLAAAVEARAEADRVARHAGELSRRLAAAKDAAAAAPAAPAAPVVDDLALARITRASERGTLRALGLSALVTRHGGVEQVEQLLEGVGRLMKAVG